MSYTIVLGDLGPIFPVTLQDNGSAFVLDTMKDTVKLVYTDPAGISHEVSMTILDAPTGSVARTWIAGDLPVVGLYKGLIRIARTGDATFPRSFPNDGTHVLWNVY